MKWAPVIPLIGGFPLGTEKAIGTPPQFIASYTGFWANDEHYYHYQNSIKGRDVPYINLTEQHDHKAKLDFVVCTPPCAGLSALNSGKSPKSKGASCQKNDWMYQSAIDAIERYNVDVVIGENAPRLFTKAGQEVVDKLEIIAKERGYSLSLYKTNTLLHGIPQRRERTFYFLWKGDKVPLLNFIKKPNDNLIDYLSQIPKDSLHYDEIINEKVMTEPYFSFVVHKFGKDRARELILDNKTGNTAHNFLRDNNYLEETLKWFEETQNEKGLKLLKHAMKKYADKKGIWDGSVHVFGNHINAVIGRNMHDSIHPTEDRSLNVREALYLMGFPHDFEIKNYKEGMGYLIPQNVPTCTASDIVIEATQALLNNRQWTNYNFIRQDNMKQKNILKENNSSLSRFFNLQNTNFTIQ